MTVNPESLELNLKIQDSFKFAKKNQAKSCSTDQKFYFVSPLPVSQYTLLIIKITIIEGMKGGKK